MWINSDGNEIVSIFKRINEIKLSNDAKEILDIALLTNSYLPKKNISEDEFLNYKTDYLIQNGNLELIKLLIKIILICLVLLIVVILIDRIDFPSPTKKIEKAIPNENFKIVK